MTKTKVYWAVAVLAGLFILAKTPLVFTLFALLMLGIIPGTSLVIPAWVTLLAYPALLIALIVWLRSRPLTPIKPVHAKSKVRYTPPKPRTKKTAAKRKPAAKRRSEVTA